MEIPRTLSKQEAWFNQIVAPNSGFGEFELNFAPITDSRVFGRHLCWALIAEIWVLKVWAVCSRYEINRPQASQNILQAA
jgi:hypothetical protein